MAELIEKARADRSLIDAVIAQGARIDRTRAAVRRARAGRRIVLDLVVVLGVVGAAVLSQAYTGDAQSDATSALSLLMAGLAVSAGSAAALMMVFAARLTGSPRITWVGLTIGWYSLLAIPIATVGGLDGYQEPLAAAGIVLVHAVGLLLWLLVLVAPAPPTATRLLWGLVGVVTVLVIGAAQWAVAAPGFAETVAGSRPWWLACSLVWIVGGLVVVGRANLRHVPGLGIIGAGFAMLGAVQAGWFVVPPSGVGTTPLFAALQLAAVAVVLCGGLRVLRRALLRLNVEQAVAEKELRGAELQLARAAERDHDLRNGLAGLAGATAVLGGGTDSGALRLVVAGELRRLDGMLAQPSGQARNGSRDAYAVAPALDGLVMLRRSIGMDVRADVEPGLCAVGSPGTLAQVVTNLLANAERHAPGSPVRLAALRRDDRVEIRVRDFGPGVRPGRERAVLEPGTRDERAGGLGLGLHVCRTLLVAEDATIEILPADEHSPGCVVVLELPAGELAGSERTGPRECTQRPRQMRDPSPIAS
jgi:two-component system OmpR family sensor kinase